MSEQGKLSRGQWMVLAAAFLGWMFDGVEIGLFPLVARPALQELLQVTDDQLVGRWNGILAASFLLGAALGGVTFGWLGDRIGRVRAMVLSVLAYSIFTGAGYLATHPIHLGIFRFIASLGMGGEWAVGVALVMECWPERLRPRLAGAIGAASNIGFLLIAIIAFYKPVTPSSWRWIMLVGAAPALLALFIIYFVPESERWKESRKKAARQPLIELFSRTMRFRTILAIVLSGIPLIGTWAAVSGWIPLWVEQIKENQLLRVQMAKVEPTLAIDTGKPLPKELQEKVTPEQLKEVKHDAARSKAAVQILMAFGAILACYVAPLIGNIWGRRPTYFGLCLLSLVLCAYIFRGFDTFTPGFQAMALIVGAVTAAFYGWLPLYLPEVFPTAIRATGQGLAYNSGRVLAAVGALYMGDLVRLLGGDYARAGATITLIYIAGMICIWFGPETKGKPLPE